MTEATNAALAAYRTELKDVAPGLDEKPDDETAAMLIADLRSGLGEGVVSLSDDFMP